MSKFVKNNVKNIEISGIRKFNQLASKTPGVIKLTIGELDFNTPLSVKEKAIQAILNNQTRYTTNQGLELLRKKLSKKYLLFNPDEFIITVGTTEGLSIVIKSIIDDGDEVLIPTPGYVGYEPLIQLENGKVNYIDTTNSDFRVTKEALNKAFTAKTKAIIITNPNNPTGLTLTSEEMNIIGTFALEKDILLIADEIYSDTSKTAISFASYPELKENLILLNGFSKSHAMTGFRVGYVAADENLIKEFLKVHQYNVTSATSISQFAAIEAATTKFIDLAEKLEERRNLIITELKDLDIITYQPDGAFYILLDISKYSESSEAFCLQLLEQEKLALIPGEYFLGNHKQYVRLSYAADLDTLLEATKRLKRFLTN